MKQIHYIAGLTITVFITLHLFNHLISLFGIEAHIQMMDTLRVFYRNIIVETLLLVAVLIQFFSGIKLFFIKKKTAKSFFEKLQLWSGIYLAVFFVFHIGAIFTGRFVLNLDTNTYFGIAGLNTFPFMLFFIPYYGLAIISFFGHVAAIHNSKMKHKILGATPKKQAYLILFFGIVVSLLILYGLTNKFSGIQIPEEYLLSINK